MTRGNLYIVTAGGTAGPRLAYALDWIFREQLGLGYQLLLPDDPRAADAHIRYGVPGGTGLGIPDAGLLRQSGTAPVALETGYWEQIPTLFPVRGSEYDLPFDLFSAVFYLLSRYEEYGRFEPDRHGRFPATESVLYRYGWLRRPLVDEWLCALRTLFRRRGLDVPEPVFELQASYDIDIAWSYKHKGWRRNLGGLARDLLRGNTQDIGMRLACWLGRRRDPYDSFGFLEALHRQRPGIQPLYFVLSTLHRSRFDKNISPAHPSMRRLICDMAAHATVGLHPSYGSSVHPSLLLEEKTMLETVLGEKVVRSRQHYLRMQVPTTWVQLSDMGIADEYTMGYGTHLGFRAGTGRSFPLYDLPAEQARVVRIHPFCFMDSTARFDEGMDAGTAFQVLGEMRESLERTGSKLMTVFHNFSLGGDRHWPGWQEAYRKFLEG